MSSSERVRLIVRGAPAMEVAISDSRFQDVAVGMSGLETELPPGPYALRICEMGVTRYTDLILRESDSPVVIDLQPTPFPSSAPLDHTTTTHEWHRDPAVKLCEELLRDHEQGMFVFVREVASSSQPEFAIAENDSRRHYARSYSELRPANPGIGLTLHDAEGALLLDLGERGRCDENQHWAAGAIGGAPGLYRLRSTDPISGTQFELPVIIPRGRFVQLFLFALERDGILRPNLSSATIFISREREFHPDHPGRHAEAMIQEALRADRRVPHVGTMITQYEKWIGDDAPMLGLCLGYLALRAPHVDAELRNRVLGIGTELQKQLGDHPDVLALRAAAWPDPRELLKHVFRLTKQLGEPDTPMFKLFESILGRSELVNPDMPELIDHLGHALSFIRQLPKRLRDHPDVLALQAAALLCMPVSIELPPMLVASWRALVTASYRHYVIKFGSWPDRIAETVASATPWLIWSGFAPARVKDARQIGLAYVSALLDIPKIFDAVAQTRELSPLAARIAHALAPRLDPDVRDLELRYEIPASREEWNAASLGNAILVPSCTLQRGLAELFALLLRTAAESPILEDLGRLDVDPQIIASLADMLGRALQSSRPQLACSYLLLAGDVCCEHDWRDRAVSCYQLALELDVHAYRAYDGLADIYTKSGDFKALADLLTARARLDDDLDLLHEAAVAWVRAGHLDRAVSLWEEVTRRTEAHHDGAFHALVSAYEDASDWSHLARLLESRATISESSAERADLYMRAARLQRDQFDDPSRASEMYQNVLRVDPEATLPRAALAAIERERTRGLDDLSERRGYDPQFISGYTIPLPLVPRSLAAPLVNDPAAINLRYEHFSLVMHARRRMPFFSALNIDSGSRARPFIVQRRTDTRIDDRFVTLASPTHASMELVALTRHEDVAWGDPEEARRAFVDTHRVTNFVVQHTRLREYAEFWRDVEQKLQRSYGAAAPRLSVFQGPIFRDSDPIYDGVKTPIQFWKVLVWASPNGLNVIGLIVSQQKLLQVPSVSLVSQWRASVETIEVETELEFPDVLVEYDTFDSSWERLHRILRWGDILPPSVLFAAPES